MTHSKKKKYVNKIKIKMKTMKEKIPNEISKKLVLSFPSGKLSTSGKKRVSTDAAAAISEALRLFLLDAHR